MRYKVYNNENELVATFPIEIEADDYARLIDGYIIDTQETKEEAERIKEHKQ